MLVCLALIGVVLLQRSEGGAFGTGSPTGLVTARGAGDLLTRTTWVLFTLFLTLSLTLTLLGGRERSSQAILQRLKNVTVNPDLLVKPAQPLTAPTGNSPTAPLPTGQSPAQSTPPALQLPPIGSTGTPKSRPAHAAARAIPVITAPPPPAAAKPAQATPPAPALATPAPLALPPLSTPTNGSGNAPSH
jgi:preprotein translocase subunit SecG